MTPAEAVHTFARRYCDERIHRWHTEYTPLANTGRDRRGSDYTPEAYAIFPRYNVLHAIRLDVEAFDFERLPSVGELGELLIVAGRSANTEFTKGLSSPIARTVDQEERELFVEAIRAAIADGLPEQVPLHYRRVLRAIEIENLRQRIAATWGAPNGYWYPLGAKSHPTLVALELDKIDGPRLQERIQKFFRDNGIRRVFELREFGRENYYLDADIGDLFYNGAEGYWICESNDWIVYCSHERTITLGGTIAKITKP